MNAETMARVLGGATRGINGWWQAKCPAHDDHRASLSLHDTDSGDWVSVGTFHMRGGDDRVVLWSGVPIARYQQLVVTSEVEGSTGGGHGDVLLEGQLQRRCTRSPSPRTPRPCARSARRR